MVHKDRLHPSLQLHKNQGKIKAGHFRTPEIIFRVSGNNMAFRNADIQPILPCLEVRLESVLLVPLEVGHI